MEPDHAEKAAGRTWREYHILGTNTIRWGVWLSLLTIFVAAIGLWLAWGHGRMATVVITTGAAILGLGAGFALPWCLLWLTAPAVQRNEAREALGASEYARSLRENEFGRVSEQLRLANIGSTDLQNELDEKTAELQRLKQEREFPRGRIEVRDYGYFDADDGVTLLLFGVQMTNRETSRKMNLQVEFVLRLFTAITRHNPDLKPLEVNLSVEKRGKNPPPDLLILDAQHSSGELNYAARWDLGEGVEFDTETSSFKPEQPEDAFLLRVFDLQSGKRVEIAIPGVWEA